jgi:lipoprotein signal peptidase
LKSKTKTTSESLADQAGPERRAWKSPGALTVFLAILLSGLAADLASKHYVFRSLLETPEVRGQAKVLARQMEKPVVHQVLPILRERQVLTRDVGLGMHWTLSLNPGVVFGTPMAPEMVSLATLVTVALVVGMFLSSPAHFRATHVALGLILAGALGNWYDRLFSSVEIPGIGGSIDRHVRDFIDFSSLTIWGKSIYPWIFNLADVFLVVGVAILMIHWAIVQRKPVQAQGD